jgi:hypothetical protein
MKSALRIVLFLLANIAYATSPEPWVAGTGQFRRELYEVWVDPLERHGTTWNAERDDWPLSISQAISRARSSLTKLMGDDQQHFSLREATLRRFFSSPATDQASWYFLVVFESVHETLITRTQPGGYSPAVFPFVVFPDGSVNLPVKKKPNKSPEPTSTRTP